MDKDWFKVVIEPGEIKVFEALKKQYDYDAWDRIYRRDNTDGPPKG